MLCEVIGYYSVYCGNEYIGYINATNNNTVGVESANPEQYDLELLFNYESLINKLRQRKPAFSVWNQYGLFRFVAREHHTNIYDCLYEDKGFA